MTATLLRLRTAARRRWDGSDRISARLELVLGPIRTATEPLTALGWTVIIGSIISWWIGGRLGWEELLVVSGAGFVAVVVAMASTVGRLGLKIDLTVDPHRVVEQDPDQREEPEVVAGIAVSNPSGRIMLGGRVEVPVGSNTATFEVGRLAAGATFDDGFLVPTRRRAVIDVGPARVVRGDPLGIARRETTAGEAVRVYVHPRTTVLTSLNAGWLRDLEGRATNELSPSDIAFHTLREFVPGDDRRHIHWRTTVRTGKKMVRQFVDTRRSHLGLVLSTTATDWTDDEAFELGVRVAGSIGRTALVDGQEVTAISGRHFMAAPTSPLLLDSLAGVDLEEGEGLAIDELVRRSLLFMSHASVVSLVVGGGVDSRRLRAACAYFGADREVHAFRCVPGTAVVRQRVGNVSVFDVGDLESVARVVSVVGVR